jgi:hypothetical protein
MPPHPVAQEGIQIAARTEEAQAERIVAVFILIATVAIAFVRVAKANADDLAVGNQLVLWELVRPDRLGCPAVFTCRRHRGDTTPAVVFANDPDEMNGVSWQPGSGRRIVMAVSRSARYERSLVSSTTSR